MIPDELLLIERDGRRDGAWRVVLHQQTPEQ
jgi:hypothetical protein